MFNDFKRHLSKRKNLVVAIVIFLLVIYAFSKNQKFSLLTVVFAVIAGLLGVFIISWGSDNPEDKWSSKKDE